jgi:hypothetical protein
MGVLLAGQTSERPDGYGRASPGTGHSCGDLVATLVAGSKYGYALLWCAVLGCLMKIVLAEGAGRYSLDGLHGGRFYHGYILWLTFPPMVMMFLGQPVALILAYGVLGAFFMPFPAVTLLWILNTDRTPPSGA